MSIRADAESLRHIALFRECDSVPLQVMAFAAERQNFMPGENIITEGQAASAAFFIMSGEASVQSKHQEIALAEPGSMLGETAMISKARYAVSAIAKLPVQCARIDHGLFLRVVAEYPDFGRAVAMALSKRLEQSMREFDSVRSMIGKGRGFSDLK